MIAVALQLSRLAGHRLEDTWTVRAILQSAIPIQRALNRRRGERNPSSLLTQIVASAERSIAIAKYMVRNCIFPPLPWPIARYTVSFTAALFSRRPAPSSIVFPLVFVRARRAGRAGGASYRRIFAVVIQRWLSRETGEAAKGRERLAEKRVANREGKPTATTDQYIVCPILTSNDRFFGSSSEFPRNLETIFI